MVEETAKNDAKRLMQSLRYEPDTEKFKPVLAQSGFDEQLEALRSVATDRNLDKDFGLRKENFPAKVALLHERTSGVNAAAVDDVLVPAAATGHSDLFGFLFGHAKNLGSPEGQARLGKALLEAAGGGQSQPEDRFAGDNIAKLLEAHKPDSDHLLEAMQAAVAKGAAAQVKALAEHAGQHAPEIINRPLKGGKTLFEQAIESRLRRTVSVEAADQMASALLDAGAKPPASIEGIDTLTVMLDEKFNPRTVSKAARALGQEVPDRSFAEMYGKPKAGETPEQETRTAVITRTR